MAFQLGLVAFGPPGWAAAIAITAGMLLVGAMAAEGDLGISEESPIYQWTHPDGGDSRQTEPVQPKVITPSVTPEEAESYYEGGEIPLIIDGETHSEGQNRTFDEDEYTAGELAPVFEPAQPWGYVSVVQHSTVPDGEPNEEDDFTQPPSSKFQLSASAYESGAKYVLIFVSIFLLSYMAAYGISKAGTPGRH